MIQEVDGVQIITLTVPGGEVGFFILRDIILCATNR